MVYDGYLSLGGNEVVNSERVRGNALTGDCTVDWFVAPECSTLATALGHNTYGLDSDESPWYDPNLPDLSDRFLGAYGLSISGTEDSTASAPVEEGILDGGVIGRTRKSPREVRVRAVLAAIGRDALEYGKTWLASALAPGACGQHGDACGTTDLEFLVDCPPERRTEATYTPWSTVAENLFVNPIPSRMDNLWSVRQGGTQADMTLMDGFMRTVSSVEATAVRIGPDETDLEAQLVPVFPGTEYAYSADVRASIDWYGRMRMVYLDENRAEITTTLPSNIHVPANEWATLTATSTAPDGAVFVLPVIGVSAEASGPVPVGTIVDTRHMLAAEVGQDAEGSPVSPAYLDGSMPPEFDEYGTQDVRYRWTGPTAQSTSVRDTRSVIIAPETDEEYADRLMDGFRYLHDVSVTSGPIEVEAFFSKSNPGLVGATVEFTITSERPYVYGVTRKAALGATTPSAYSDIPFNLIRYPSSAVSDGVPRAMTTNYSRNGSAEGGSYWYGRLNEAALTGFGEFTTDIATIGTRSYRGVYTLPAGEPEQEVSLMVATQIAVADVPEGGLPSVTMWGMLQAREGTPELIRLECKVRFLGYNTSGSLVYTANPAIEIGSTEDPIDFEGMVFSKTGTELPRESPTSGIEVIAARICMYGTALMKPGDTVAVYGDAAGYTIP